MLSARRRIALAVGGVEAFVLALSVSHCTDALVATTGAPWALAGLLAVGIDCGMVAATVAGKSARRWAKAYVAVAMGLSMLLNALASAQHAGARVHGSGLRSRGRVPGAGLHPRRGGILALDGGVSPSPRSRSHRPSLAGRALARLVVGGAVPGQWV